jgi:hypothetical protein
MKKLLLLFAVFLIYTAGYSQNNFWLPVSKEKVARLDKTERGAMPNAYHLFNLDLTMLKSALATAPEVNSGTSSLIIPFPDGDGNVKNYRIYEASVMDAELAAKHPEIKSYVGQGIANPAATIRFSTTIFGLHAMILSPEGTVYTDPYTVDTKNYIIYKKADLIEERGFICSATESHSLNGRAEEADMPLTTFANDGVLRTFRLAMACTTEYAAYHFSRAGKANGTDAEKKAAVLAAMNVTMTRVNGVYEQELAITMKLVANNEAIIFISGEDGFSNTNANRLLSESQRIITATIGSANFDIGHTVSTGGGGLALLGVVCNTSEKASGITGSDAPVGDPYDIDYVAHEMGHQFGADHTFNGVSGNCGGNNNNETAVEPGGGTTIMAYAGICGAADIQSNSNAYFHKVSHDEIYNYIKNTNCAVRTPLRNTAPQIDFLESYTIPKSTAFVLRGSDVTDNENNALTYCWEQIDGVPNDSFQINVPTTTATEGPNFRSLSPTTSKNRYMPVLSSVLVNELAPKWEKVPSVGRDFNFAYTVRDNNAGGGQTNSATMMVSVSSIAGPFAVTSQNTTGISWAANTLQTINWNVAGTNANGIDTAAVNIILSTNGGQTFTTVLANATPNDGRETITVPGGLQSTNCRIMVEAVGNIFYAVNRNAFTVTGPLSAESFGLKDFAIFPNPNNGSFNITFASVTQNNVGITVYDMRGRQVFANNYANSGTFTTTVKLSGLQSGVYIVNVQDGNRKEVRKIIIQ